MKFQTLPAADYVLRPTVTFSIAWFGVVAVWFLWLLCTVRYPADGEPRISIISGVELIGASLVQAGFLAGLLWEASRWRLAAPGVRRGQAAGVALALLLLGLTQWGLYLANLPLGPRG